MTVNKIFELTNILDLDKNCILIINIRLHEKYCNKNVVII